MSDYSLDAPAGEAVLTESRTLDAPRALVWKAMTDPYHFARWWGPHGYTNPVCELDVRPGGKWRVHQQNAAGQVFKFHGEFLEVEPPMRMVQTFAFADYPPARIEFRLEEIDGRTRMISTMRFESVALRDGMIGSGMEKGARESYERLDVVLAELKAAERDRGAAAPA